MYLVVRCHACYEKCLERLIAVQDQVLQEVQLSPACFISSIRILPGIMSCMPKTPLPGMPPAILGLLGYCNIREKATRTFACTIKNEKMARSKSPLGKKRIRQFRGARNQSGTASRSAHHPFSRPTHPAHPEKSR